ncbi:cyclic pyranopterin monophosphate synthase MoaC [Nocardia sp. GCM10030253]|uniref:cyclic pyranopterin monophosphate synthase MoaC n=1 Tax=Nocardia sp. GCM10030253 TaxID=3273404 RepID=UPI00363787B2
MDVSARSSAARIAVAAGEVRTTAEAVAWLRGDSGLTADFLATARISGIAGAKKTSDLIPLCHQVLLSSVQLGFEFTETGITIEATVRSPGPTGVGMEALTAVAVAGLTLNYMLKGLDPFATLEAIHLVGSHDRKLDDRGFADTRAHPVHPEPETAIQLLEQGPRTRAMTPLRGPTAERAEQ